MADPSGVDWVASQPRFGQSTKKKFIHEKTNRNMWVPKNIEIRAFALHINAETLIAVCFVRNL